METGTALGERVSVGHRPSCLGFGVLVVSALKQFLALGGKVEHVRPPVPTRAWDYAAYCPWVCDKETGGELTIGEGRTAEAAAQAALEYLEDLCE